MVPVYFHGHNSRLFQIASHLHSTLRLGLLLKEFRARVDEPVPVSIGKPIAPAQLQGLTSDPNALMEICAATYDLSPEAQGFYDLGYEFEAKYKAGSGGGRAWPLASSIRGLGA